MDITAFTGRKGSGKDTAAQVLIEELNYFQINFAVTLKEMCMLVWGLTREEVLDPLLKEKPLDRWPYRTPRELMQETAQRLRDYNPEIWVMSWDRAVTKHAQNNPTGVVVTDYRYPNEGMILESSKALMIRVDRPGLKDNEFSWHVSESYFDKLPVSHVIVNDSTIEDLQNKVRAILNGDYDNA